MRRLVPPTVVGTMLFVPGGGRVRTCCKPPEPPPVSRCTFTVVRGPVARLVHVEDPAFSLCLTPSRRPAKPNQRSVLRQPNFSSTQHPRKLLNLPSRGSGRHPHSNPRQLVVELHCFSTSLSVDTTNHMHLVNLMFNGWVACLMKMTAVQIKVVSYL